MEKVQSSLKKKIQEFLDKIEVYRFFIVIKLFTFKLQEKYIYEIFILKKNLA